MLNILQEIKKNRQKYYTLLTNSITEYSYREKRYGTRFSATVIYSPNGIFENTEEIKKIFRKTDKLLALNKNMIIAIFDAVSDKSYLKAAENLCDAIHELDFQEKLYGATTYSPEFNGNYLDMTNKLFERLEYAIENNLYNDVIDQDYII